MARELIYLAILDGVSYAALLFLVALGMTLVFGVMNIINMAHGSFYAFGGYLAATFGGWAIAAGLSPAWSFLLLPLAAVLVGTVLGGLMEITLLKRIYNKDPILQLLITFSTFMIFEDLQRMIWGTQPYFVSELVKYTGVVDVMDITYTRYQLFILPSVALVAFLALRYFLRSSRTGRQIVAVAHNREVSTALGINVRKICLLTFIVASMLGALGGALASQTTSWVPGIGADMIVLSFAVVATAGLGQIEGALVAALMIGLARSFAVYLFPEIEVLVPYLIMVLVLLFRPQGLFSVAQARRV
ncbi:branched-chain amino acid ABC transporter permease [Herbaspirillum lusitanum]|uniref:branched-chain amino acid ABC transporter permease n=1 Tax=Herbaspirillum lusitanum TaxID=213312 RepID=UPI0002F1D5C1|nr:branched-chain amino acid ABC transporter permease [Herbaspirillum lusitanum]